MSSAGRTPPHNLEAEVSVLGSVLLRSDAMSQLLALPIESDDFFLPAHQDIFRGMTSLYERNQPIDPVTLEAELRRQDNLGRVGGLAYLGELQSRVPTAENVQHYANIVREAATLRQLIARASQIERRSYEAQGSVDEFLDEAETEIFQIAQRLVGSRYVHIRPVLTATFKQIERRAEKNQPVTGVPSGFPDLDRMTCGFQPSELILIAARPSVGKTSFALTIAAQAALKYKIPVLFFSIEMSKESIAERLLCSEARVDSARVRAGRQLSRAEWGQLTTAASSLYTAPLYIDDAAAPTALEIRAKARRFRSEKALFPNDESMGLIVVDYLQLVKPSGNTNSREQEVAGVSQALKALAKDLRMPVIAISQLRRAAEDRENQEPRLSDLRESGALEQDADVVSFLYRPRIDDKAQIKLAVAKQRNGPTGQVDLVFLPEWTRFESAARQMGPSGQGGHGGDDAF